MRKGTTAVLVEMMTLLVFFFGSFALAGETTKKGVEKEPKSDVDSYPGMKLAGTETEKVLVAIKAAEGKTVLELEWIPEVVRYWTCRSESECSKMARFIYVAVDVPGTTAFVMPHDCDKRIHDALEGNLHVGEWPFTKVKNEKYRFGTLVTAEQFHGIVAEAKKEGHDRVSSPEFVRAGGREWVQFILLDAAGCHFRGSYGIRWFLTREEYNKYLLTEEAKK